MSGTACARWPGRSSSSSSRHHCCIRLQRQWHTLAIPKHLAIACGLSLGIVDRCGRVHCLNVVPQAVPLRWFAFLDDWRRCHVSFINSCCYHAEFDWSVCLFQLDQRLARAGSCDVYVAPAKSSAERNRSLFIRLLDIFFESEICIVLSFLPGMLIVL